MPVVSLGRPERHRVLAVQRGHVRSRPTALFRALDSRFRPATDGADYYRADASAFLIVVQGRWWFRGEYRMVPDDRGCHLEFALLDVARWWPMLGRLCARRAIRRSAAEFQSLLRQLRLEVE